MTLRTHDLWVDINSGVPVATLRDKYPSTWWQGLCWSAFDVFWEPIYRRREDATAVLTWVCSVCGSLPTRLIYEVAALSRPCLPCVTLMAALFPLVRRPFNQPGLAWALRIVVDRRKLDTASCQRLLDGGASIDMLDDAADPKQQTVRQWYERRLRCRDACVALLSLRGATEAIRQALPGDLLRWVAEWVWRGRWVFEGPRKRIRRTLK